MASNLFHPDQSFVVDSQSPPDTQEMDMLDPERSITPEIPIHVHPAAVASQKKIVQELKASLANETRNAAFAIGGSVPITTDLIGDTTDYGKRARPIDPIHIRFGEDGKGNHLVLSLEAASSSLGYYDLGKLVAACSPASFGLGKEDVVDETYRKAGKLDTDLFTTSFCPYSAGIVDVISQVLLPTVRFPRDKYDVRAELYKLNIYSAPSGFFKPHVDTPRAETQFGSLVVSLPVHHQGGALVVRHAGSEQTFDWSDCSVQNPCVQWAAFYSDCEHEVLEVTAGHRITLTYNLYMKVSAGHLAGLYTALQPTQLPLYKTLKAALHNPKFFTEGRVLGIWLSHNYAHTSKTQNFLPSSLKGADMVFYEAATAAGLNCHVRPWVRSDEDDHRDILGSRFGPFNYEDCEEEDPRESRRQLKDVICSREGWKEDLVTWLNEYQEFSEPQMARLVYGNQAELSLSYSSAIMLITIPPFERRGQMYPVVRESGKVFEGLCNGSEGYRTEGEYSDMESSSDHDPEVRAFMQGEVLPC